MNREVRTPGRGATAFRAAVVTLVIWSFLLVIQVAVPPGWRRSLPGFFAEQFVMLAVWMHFARRAARGESLSLVVLIAATGYFSQIVGTSLLLGFTHHLTRIALTVVNGLGAAALAAASAYYPRPDPLRMDGPRLGDGWLRWANVVLAFLLTATLGLTLYQAHDHTPDTYDELHYHLPMVFLLHQNQSIDLGPAHDPIVDAYPKNIQLWYHWIFSYFKSDTWLDAGQFPFLLLAMIAVFSLARQLGGRRPYAILSALTFPFVPATMAQLQTTYIDVAVAALLLNSLALLLRLQKSFARAPFWAFAGSLGLLAGTKYSGVVQCALLGCAFVLLPLRYRPAIRALAPRLALLGLVVALLGGYAYMRNMIQHNNPFYPYETALFPGLEFQGPRDASDVHGERQTALVSPIRKIMISWLTVDESRHSRIWGGFGYAVIFFPFLFLSAAYSFAKKDWPRFNLLLLGAALLIMTPVNYRVRFVLFLPGLAAVSLSHVLELIRGRRAVHAALLAGTVAVCAQVVYQVWKAHHEPSLFGNKRTRVERRDPSQSAEFETFRDAYRWTRNHADYFDRVLVFPCTNYVLPYFLWSPSAENSVAFVQPGEETLTWNDVSFTERDLAFIEKGSTADALLQNNVRPMKVEFESDDALVVRPLAPPAVQRAP